ncbi:D-alanyl-D-alanine carboxypeptidase family protein [Rhizobium sp. L1K21]|uniref:D-alanyl-D-alanine carboxypeptidase family protein n=1 Tax=Rhizobium sp. L1K21 TaxID=2954933 RepID=UPI003593A0CE
MLRIFAKAAGAALGATILLAASLAHANTAHVIVDTTSGQILESENADALVYPASLTKMMTLYLTFEALHKGALSWDSKIVLSENAESKDPYKFAIGAGRTITVKEAVLGMIVISANDAAVAMGEHLAGSEASFGKLMTERAHQLGMRDTVFTNPAGLPDPNQVTTAVDMAKLGIALKRDYPEEFKLFSEKYMTFRGMKLRGHNGLLKRYPGVDGIKTGYTEASGYNLVTSARNGGKEVVAVVMGGKTAAERDKEMAGLLDKYLGKPHSAQVADK